LSQPSIEVLKMVYQALSNFFQLAIGSSQGEAYNFDFDVFCSRYNLKQHEVFAALKKLEEFGLILLNEGFYRPSKIFFQIDKTRIYQFQVANAKYDSIIKMLLRLYGAELFSDFVVISEKQLATGLKISLEQIKKELIKLQELQVLVYEPASDEPQIIFVLPRQDAERLPIDKKEFDTRRKLHFEKMDAMIEYTEDNHRCRMQMIQEYFDEITYQTCGVCDVCISKKKNDHSKVLKDYQEQINYLLSQKPMPIDELEDAVAARDKELFVEAVRELVDTGAIAYDDVWLLHKKH